MAARAAHFSLNDSILRRRGVSRRGPRRSNLSVATQNGFQAACTRARIKGFRVHDLRHTFASWLVQGAVPLLEVAKLLGHSTIEMTERYAHLAPENLKAAVGVLDRLRSGYVERADGVVSLKASARCKSGPGH